MREGGWKKGAQFKCVCIHYITMSCSLHSTNYHNPTVAQNFVREYIQEKRRERMYAIDKRERQLPLGADPSSHSKHSKVLLLLLLPF